MSRFFARGLPVVDQPFGHHVPCNGFCGEGSAQEAAPLDRR